MNPAEYRTLAAKAMFPAPEVRARMSEAELQAWVTNLANIYRWRWYHTHDSRRSPGGFPDLVLVRSGVLIFAELKSQKGKVAGLQRPWLEDLKEVHERLRRLAGGHPVDSVRVFLWRPSMMEEIEEILR